MSDIKGKPGDASVMKLSLLTRPNLTDLKTELAIAIKAKDMGFIRSRSPTTKSSRQKRQAMIIENASILVQISLTTCRFRNQASVRTTAAAIRAMSAPGIA
jgi:hypothetical protein